MNDQNETPTIPPPSPPPPGDETPTAPHHVRHPRGADGLTLPERQAQANAARARCPEPAPPPPAGEAPFSVPSVEELLDHVAEGLKRGEITTEQLVAALALCTLPRPTLEPGAEAGDGHKPFLSDCVQQSGPGLGDFIGHVTGILERFIQSRSGRYVAIAGEGIVDLRGVDSVMLIGNQIEFSASGEAFATLGESKLDAQHLRAVIKHMTEPDGAPVLWLVGA